jgi:hypothetical protein
MPRTTDQGLTGSVGLPELTTAQNARLNISVIATSEKCTRAALRKAGGLAKDLGTQITLIVPQVVPYALPLTRPPVSMEFLKKQFTEIAADCPVDVEVRLIFCRDEVETLRSVLKPDSIVVIGGRSRLWPTRESRLVRRLQRANQVIFEEL